MLCAPVAVFGAVVSFQLFGPVPIGLADNGDFPRVLGPLRLWPASVPPATRDSKSLFRYFTPRYVVSDPVYDPGIPNSEQYIALAALGVSRMFLPEGRFDLRAMGAIHALLMALALFWFLWALRREAPWVRVLSAILILSMWTDVMYVQQFSTAYTDAGAIAALCLAFSVALIGLLTPEGSSLKWAVAFALCAAFLLGTKLQHAFAIVPLGAFAIFMAARRARTWPARIIWWSTPALLLATVLFMVRETPDDYRRPPAFTVVFYKLAVLSKEPDRVLAAFHMSVEEFGKYVGHYVYEPMVPTDESFHKRILALVTPARIASFYVHNPDVLIKVVRSDWLQYASLVNLHVYFGHMREADTIAGKASPDFHVWSGSRTALFRFAPFYPLAFFGLALGLCLAGLVSGKMRARFPLWPVPAMMAFTAIACFLSSSLLDASETARHLVLFQAAEDLTILALFLSIATRASIGAGEVFENRFAQQRRREQALRKNEVVKFLNVESWPHGLFRGLTNPEQTGQTIEVGHGLTGAPESKPLHFFSGEGL